MATELPGGGGGRWARGRARRGTAHYATAGMTGSGDRFMGVKKWPGPLNRVIKCRYFKQQSELECASELYLHGGDTGFKTHVEIPWPIVSSPIYYAVSPPLNGGERNNERGVVHDMTFKRRIFSFLFFFFFFFCRPRKWVERVESS